MKYISDDEYVDLDMEKLAIETSDSNRSKGFVLQTASHFVDNGIKVFPIGTVSWENNLTVTRLLVSISSDGLVQLEGIANFGRLSTRKGHVTTNPNFVVGFYDRQLNELTPGWSTSSFEKNCHNHNPRKVISTIQREPDIFDKTVGLVIYGTRFYWWYC